MTRIVKVLNDTLLELLQDDPRVHIFGESIEDPYGGAFKVTKGLSTAFPKRVFDTPISEAGLTGFATGMALRGQRPILEIMFGDFMTLCLDQILNSMTKMRVMFGVDLPVPVVIRTPMGGGRGYGPTHSQTLEKMFIGIPHLQVVAPSALHDVRALLRHLVLESQDPTLFIEHKLLYGETVRTDEDLRSAGWAVERVGAPLETVVLGRPGRDRHDATLITYGGMVSLALGVAKRLHDEEDVAIELVIPSSLSPLDMKPMLGSIARTGKGIVLEEGTKTGGWAAEVACRIHEEAAAHIEGPIIRVAAKDAVLPCALDLERAMLPDEHRLAEAIIGLV
jgi:pyruvate/2-oxoglutarate/acetoin dehydrogenase E1 component